MNGAQIIVKCLEKEGINIVFGYPGATIAPFYDAIIDSNITHVLTRQEQNAGHAASGYARTSGKPAVCVTTSGPGATNIITAIATAYMDSIPIVCITGQVKTDQLGRDVFQEVDITGATEPFTKHSYLVKDTQELPRIIKEAFHIASTGRPGPVLIDIPQDIQENEFEGEFVYPDKVNIIGYKPRFKGHALQIKKAAAAIAKAKRPVICAGGGVVTSQARDALINFSEKTEIPIVSTLMGVGIMPSVHPHYLGMLGTHGVFSANKAIHEADLLIIFGARVGDRALAQPDQITQRAEIIHIDIDPAEIGKNIKVDIPIVGNAGSIIKDLTAQCPEMEHAAWMAQITEWKAANTTEFDSRDGFVEPRTFIQKLSEKVGNEAILCADVGQNQIWAANNFKFREGRFLTSGGMGTMGYSIPAAIGAKMAKPHRDVYVVCGDGSFQMMFNELATICQNDVSIKIIVMKNTRLGMVRELQDNLYKGRYSGTFLDGSPDFVKLAQAYSIDAMSINSDDEVDGAIDRLINSEKTFVLECVVAYDTPSRQINKL